MSVKENKIPAFKCFHTLLSASKLTVVVLLSHYLLLFIAEYGLLRKHMFDLKS